MREDYDFSSAERGAIIASPGKARITIMLDDDVIAHFRAQAEAQGVGHRTLINASLRRVLRGELHTSSAASEGAAPNGHPYRQRGACGPAASADSSSLTLARSADTPPWSLARSNL